jgi:hypothetical protein
VAAVYKNDVGDAFKGALKKSLANYSNNEAEKIAWDDTQTKVKVYI